MLVLQADYAFRLWCAPELQGRGDDVYAWELVEHHKRRIATQLAPPQQCVAVNGETVEMMRSDSR